MNNMLVQTIGKVISILKYEFVPVGVSGRHIHLSRQDLEALFGQEVALSKLKDLKQPGEFAANEVLTISGKKGKFEKVRILGPTRKSTQVELSLSDCLKLGVSAPVSESGKLDNAGMITLSNPDTGVSIERKAAIAALRHIHMPPEHAEKLGLRDRQMVSVEFGGERSVIYNNVLLRVSDAFVPEMHLDTDEANAGGIGNGMPGRIISKVHTVSG